MAGTAFLGRPVLSLRVLVVLVLAALPVAVWLFAEEVTLSFTIESGPELV